MSNILPVIPGALAYCDQCADVYGTLDDKTKRCACPASQDLIPWQGGDFPTPFEICWYCQAAIIRSGSKWSTYYCEECRPVVRSLNDQLEQLGLVSLPVGRHSLQHGPWRHARPFTSSKVVQEWKLRRLRQLWSLYVGDDQEWSRFAAFIKVADGRNQALAQVCRLVQSSTDDVVFEALNAANARLRRQREKPQ